MSATTITNADRKPRKQLSDQLDRLDGQLERVDGVLDALADGLNGAVADAAQEGVKAAVQAAVVELLTNPGLRNALHLASAPPDGPKPPSGWARLKDRVRRAAGQVKETVAGVVESVTVRVASAAATVVQVATRVVSKVREAGAVRTAVRVLLAAGALVVAARYAAAKKVGELAWKAKGIVTDFVGRVLIGAKTAVVRLATA